MTRGTYLALADLEERRELGGMGNVAGEAVADRNRAMDEGPFHKIGMAHEAEFSLRLGEPVLFILVMAVIAPAFRVRLMPRFFMTGGSISLTLFVVRLLGGGDNFISVFLAVVFGGGEARDSVKNSRKYFVIGDGAAAL